ncbi:MAG: DUF3418 domain-containing protein, partial [Dermatophilaceae bacterium]
VAGLALGPVRTEAAWDAALVAVRTHGAARMVTVVEATVPVLLEAAAVRRSLEVLERGSAAAATAASRADVGAQVAGLVGPGFVSAAGLARLPDVLRYLRAARHRCERAAANHREPVLQQTVDRVEAAYADLLDALPPERRQAAEVVDIGWLVEELRVSLFAQSMGTARPVSEKRVAAAIAAVGTSLAPGRIG